MENTVRGEDDFKSELDQLDYSGSAPVERRHAESFER